MNLKSFLSGCSDVGTSLNTIDKIQCCIVLLQSLPCARHAVLEQLCDAFHESMHKYMVEMERKAQLQGKPIWGVLKVVYRALILNIPVNIILILCLGTGCLCCSGGWGLCPKR